VKSNILAPGAKRYGEVLKSLLELRQLCLWQKHPTLHSTKIDFLMETLETLVEEGHKTLIFSQFTTYLDLIENKIRVAGWKHARIDGSQTIKKRGEQVELFQNGDAQIFLISLKAGGFGLNLTAASYIFLMDPWWNPAVERQAIDRAHRIGQENKLTVYRPIIKESVEEKVLVLQQSKRELFRDLMAEDDDDYFSGKLTMDDFQHLLS
jgi:SNF2 family DNA or RNA helicase